MERTYTEAEVRKIATTTLNVATLQISAHFDPIYLRIMEEFGSLPNIVKKCEQLATVHRDNAATMVIDEILRQAAAEQDAAMAAKN